MRLPVPLRYYPSDWKGSRWVQVKPYDHVDLPALPGVYAIYLDGKLTYVGQSVCLADRFQTHNIRLRYSPGWFTPWGQCRELLIKVRFATIYGGWLMRETQLIRRLHPPMNRRQCNQSRKQKKMVVAA